MSFDALDVADKAFDTAFWIIGVLAFADGQKVCKNLYASLVPEVVSFVATWDQEQRAAPQYLASKVLDELFPGRPL